MDPADFVLRDFSAAERKLLPLVLERAADAVETLLRHRLAAAQRQFHSAPAAETVADREKGPGEQG
jgi:PTH1 family peptidyl-tRNA hydrolase